MAVNTVSVLASKVNENGLKFVENNGQILFSAEEIGRQLGYKRPAKSVNIIYNRNQKELNSYAVGIKLMSTDGKHYEVRHFTEEGVYILSMLAQTPQAAQFRARVAALLRRIREERVNLAHECGYRQGYDEGRASALPDVKSAEETARRNTAQSILTLTPGRLALLKASLKYAALGLSVRETAKLLDADRRAVGHLLTLARRNGLLPGRRRPTQGSLLELPSGEGKEV